MTEREIINRLQKLKKMQDFPLIGTIGLGVFLVMTGLSTVATLNDNTHPGKSAIIWHAFALIATAIYFILLNTYAKKAKKAFKALYKQTFVVNVLSNYFDDVIYKWDSGFLPEQVKYYGLCELGNEFHSEDYLSGVYNDISFRQADVKISYKLSDASTSHTTYFEGRMFVFELPDQKSNGLQVHSKKFYNEAPSPTGHAFQKILTGNEEFDRNFTVRAANEQEVKNILTPTVMARIQDLGTRYMSLVLYFSNNKLHLGIQGVPDTFDPPSDRKRFDYATERERIRKDIQIITDVIDTMTQSSVM